MINEWNKLSNDCVNASSVTMFKNRIERYLIRVGYTVAPRYNARYYVDSDITRSVVDPEFLKMSNGPA